MVKQSTRAADLKKHPSTGQQFFEKLHFKFPGYRGEKVCGFRCGFESNGACIFTTPFIKKHCRFDVEVFVPKRYIDDGVHSGVYLMRFMDTYKGKKQGYTPCFKDIAQLKSFSCRACYRILTSAQNKLNSKVTKGV